jgi:hypothetical protein
MGGNDSAHGFVTLTLVLAMAYAGAKCLPVSTALAMSLSASTLLRRQKLRGEFEMAIKTPPWQRAGHDIFDQDKRELSGRRTASRGKGQQQAGASSQCLLHPRCYGSLDLRARYGKGENG